MALEITGRLVRVLDVRSGMGKNGEWKNQDFILEMSGQFPRQVCISLWGDKIDALKNFNIGDPMKVYFDVESREYQEKWYTSVKAWQLEKVDISANLPIVGLTASPINLPTPPSASAADIPPEEDEIDVLPF